jgi:hypothetical protein
MINKEHLTDLDQRANHHARNCIQSITLSLGFLNQIGAKIKKHRKNVFWFDLDNNKYVIAYNHEKKKIDVRNKSQKGDCVFDFDDSTSYQYLKDNFNNL